MKLCIFGSDDLKASDTLKTVNFADGVFNGVRAYQPMLFLINECKPFIFQSNPKSMFAAPTSVLPSNQMWSEEIMVVSN